MLRVPLRMTWVPPLKSVTSGGGPGGDLVAGGFPDGGAGLGVEAVEGGIDLLVPVEEEPAAVQHGRDGFAVAAAGGEAAELAFPERFSVEGETEDAEGAEGDVEALAVGRRGAGGVGVGGVVALVRDEFGDGFLPEQLAGVAVVAGNQEAEEIGGFGGLALVAGARRRAFGGIGDILGLGLAAGVFRGGDEDSVAPDDRRGGALAGEFGAPADVFAGGAVPGDGRAGGGRGAVGVGAAPMRPVGVGRGGGGGGDGRGERQGEGQDERDQGGARDPGRVLRSINRVRGGSAGRLAEAHRAGG